MTARAIGAILCAVLATVLAALALPGAVFWSFGAGLVLGAGLAWLALAGTREVTLARKTAHARRSVVDHAAAVVDAYPDPALLLTRRINVLHANPAALKAFPALRSGEPLSFVIRDPGLLAAVQAGADRGGVQQVDLVERVPVERSFACTATQLASAGVDGRDGACVLLVLHDTSSRRAVEAMRVDFIANASHELRTPLAAILGFTETLQGPARADAAARDRFLPIMAEQARRMARLVDDLLSLSRIEMKEHLVPSGTVDLGQIVGETAQALSGLASERNVQINLDLPDHPVRVIGDRDELLSVFDNLIENALKYGKGGNRIDVTLRVEGAEASLAVRDYGAGIASEHLPRLTERFYRVDNAISRLEGGTGLGLALVKHTVSRHRGKLTIHSVAGQGACFTVILPCAPEPDAQVS